MVDLPQQYNFYSDQPIVQDKEDFLCFYLAFARARAKEGKQPLPNPAYSFAIDSVVRKPHWQSY